MSSGESELYALGARSAELIFAQAILKETGLSFLIHARADSSTARALATKQGASRMMIHIHTRFLIVLRHWKTCVSGHTSAPPRIPRKVDDLETVEFADVLGAIAEDHHLTRCAQVCFIAEQHNHRTIHKVPRDQDTKQGGNALKEADREADLLEQMPLPGHPESEKERPASWLRLLRRARVAIGRLHRNFRHLPKEAFVQSSCLESKGGDVDPLRQMERWICSLIQCTLVDFV